jgi:putative transposase
MAWRVLRREPGGPWSGVNHKRIRRLWREEGLRRPARTHKRRRVTAEQAERLRAERPNQVWAIDFQFDETSDGRRLKLANIVDEHTREALAMRVGRTCTADDLVEVLAGLVAVRGAPEHLRMDNGPELLAWALRDYCRLAGPRTTYIEPGAPWENPYVESFNGRVRDELLNLEEFTSLTLAQVVVEAWRIEYNTYRPHSALDGLTLPNTQPTGPAPTNPHSHSGWTTNRGPIS